MKKILLSLNTAEAVDNVIKRQNCMSAPAPSLNTAEAVDNVISFGEVFWVL